MKLKINVSLVLGPVNSALLLITVTCAKVMETGLRVMEMVAVNAYKDGQSIQQYHLNASVEMNSLIKTMYVSVVVR